jgi:hypothetical protein
MIENRQRVKKAIPYLTTKIASAGFLMFVLSICFILLTGLDMYEFVEEISNWYIWAILYGYGILCSMFIDLILIKKTKMDSFIRIILYIVAGYAIFLINGMNAFTLIAGTVGALCSIIFYFGTLLSSGYKIIKPAFAVLVPLTLLLLTNVDFTEKEQWVEEKGDNTYSATFDHFNGKHEIPLNLKAGQTITIYHEFHNTNGGGHGFHILNERNHLVGVTEGIDNEVILEVEDAGIYRIVITGDDVKGGFNVAWK